MIDVPDEKTITGLTRSELIAMVYSLKNERDEKERTIVNFGSWIDRTGFRTVYSPGEVVGAWDDAREKAKTP